jgi:NAD(P)-dependent dehydrogenase (short-subunit alcohol dehydrogenase family)
VVDLKGKGIRVNAASPGVIPTPGYHTSLEMTERQLNDDIQSVTPAIPLGRTGTTDEFTPPAANSPWTAVRARSEDWSAVGRLEAKQPSSRAVPRGVGLAAAKRLAKEGCRVYITAIFPRSVIREYPRPFRRLALHGGEPLKVSFPQRDIQQWFDAKGILRLASPDFNIVPASLRDLDATRLFRLFKLEFC